MHAADKLVMMANQIVRNLAVQGDERAVGMAAGHMRKFWEPRMHRQIRQYLQAGAVGLTPLAKRAVEQLVRLETPAIAPSRLEVSVWQAASISCTTPLPNCST